MRVIGSMALPAAVASVTHICISHYFDLGFFAKWVFEIFHGINSNNNLYTYAVEVVLIRATIIVYSYLMVYWLSIITVYPVWLMLRNFDKLTLTNLCFTCGVLGICCPIAGYFYLGSRSPLMFVLYRPEVIMSYLLSAVVFALVLWWVVHGAKSKASTDVRQDSEDYG